VGGIEARHHAYLTYDAWQAAIELSSQYLHDKALPQKAIDILEEAATIADKESKKEGSRLVTRAQVAEVIHERTNIPVERAMGQESQKLLQLEDTIHEQMIDQEEAVSAVAASLRRARAQLTEGKRPIANFLFLGPTGVGKTELAKTISRIYFGGEEYMVRIDMSEYQHPDSVKKLIGSGKANLGYLTEAVRRQPFALVLLDEFEKAHPQILNLFLQVMDDGRLTDGRGRTIDFTNTILIATSNAGALYIQDQIRAGADVETIKTDLIETQLREIMRPELLNRFDDVIVFKPLSMEDVQQITQLLLGSLAKKLERQGIALEVRKGAIKKLAHDGFDPEFGARPLRRLIQDTVENQIANLLLAEKVRRRDTVILTDAGTVEVKKGKRL
jgi:ATP-dependent Clp protease ATP-binding subunit ClpA